MPPYIPREDSFLLRKHIKEFCKPAFSVLDMGTGSGILALEASRYVKNVTACDIDKKAIKELSVKLKKSKEIVHSKSTTYKSSKARSNITYIQSDLFSNLKQAKFDLIIFNPPYLPSKPVETCQHIDIDGGKNGTEVIEKFLKNAKKHLKTKGKILILTSSLDKNIEKLFKKYKYVYQLIDQEKFFFEKLFVWVLK